ncbi:MAG: MBL fold metallo-hydrolase [Armatimonadetes bacterium]|nr:MBL fold metallo-hydrolase [Armatimonadota bacterium]MDW8121422.1 MBL fold metallo-hydrolase [Armatimonadota bacterium]
MAIAAGKAILLKWLGHACFLFTIGKQTILIDPFPADRVGYTPFSVAPDVVLISHHHFDHRHLQAVKGKPKIIDQPGEYKVGAVTIRGYKTSHGNGRGENTVFIIEAGGLVIAHCGDLGVLPSESDVKSVGPVDVLLVPVGGYFTIDAKDAWKLTEMVRPKVVIPMHYRHPKSKVTVLAPVEDFLKGKKGVRKIQKSEVSLSKGTLPKDTEIWVLEPP